MNADCTLIKIEKTRVYTLTLFLTSVIWGNGAYNSLSARRRGRGWGLSGITLEKWNGTGALFGRSFVFVDILL